MNFSVASQDGSSRQFERPGLIMMDQKCLLVEEQIKRVFEYSLSTNFDISSASVSYNGNFIDVSSQVAKGNSLFGLTFSPDGTMMFVN